MTNPCGHKTSMVGDTRADNPRYTKRHRICTTCGVKWVTFEINRDEFDRFVEIEATLAKIQEQIGKALKK